MVLDVSGDMCCGNSGKSKVGSDITSGNCRRGYVWSVIWRFDDRGFNKRAWRLFEEIAFLDNNFGMDMIEGGM